MAPSKTAQEIFSIGILKLRVLFIAFLVGNRLSEKIHLCESLWNPNFIDGVL